VESHWSPSEDGSAALLDVATSDSEHVAELLAEQLGEELRRPAVPTTDRRPLLLQPPFALALSAAVLMVTFFWVTGPFDLGVGWFRQGALITRAALAGEWWRLVTAATLHSNSGHVLGNAAFLTLLGWAVAERLGGGVMLTLAVATAVVGFVASLLFSDATVTVGASGGMFGLLGAAAGHGLREARSVRTAHLHRRQQIFRVLGAAVMLLGFTAFSREANIPAHLGGFVSGLVFGLVLPRAPLGRWAQLAAGISAGAVLLGAWLMA
jgi:membrane associated rhomboid family serine protease